MPMSRKPPSLTPQNWDALQQFYPNTIESTPVALEKIQSYKDVGLLGCHPSPSSDSKTIRFSRVSFYSPYEALHSFTVAIQIDNTHIYTQAFTFENTNTDTTLRLSTLFPKNSIESLPITDRATGAAAATRSEIVDLDVSPMSFTYTQEEHLKVHQTIFTLVFGLDYSTTYMATWTCDRGSTPVFSIHEPRSIDHGSYSNIHPAYSPAYTMPIVMRITMPIAIPNISILK